MADDRAGTETGIGASAVAHGFCTCAHMQKFDRGCPHGAISIGCVQSGLAPSFVLHAQQEVMPAYARVHAAMFGEGGIVRQRVHFTRDDSRVALAYTGAEYEVYAQFDTLLDRSTAVAICQRLCAWIKGQHAELFVPLSL